MSRLSTKKTVAMKLPTCPKKTNTKTFLLVYLYLPHPKARRDLITKSLVVERVFTLVFTITLDPINLSGDTITISMEFINFQVANCSHKTTKKTTKILSRIEFIIFIEFSWNSKPDCFFRLAINICVRI